MPDTVVPVTDASEVPEVDREVPKASTDLPEDVKEMPDTVIEVIDDDIYKFLLHYNCYT